MRSVILSYHRHASIPDDFRSDTHRLCDHDFRDQLHDFAIDPVKAIDDAVSYRDHNSGERMNPGYWKDSDGARELAGSANNSEKRKTSRRE